MVHSMVDGVQGQAHAHHQHQLAFFIVVVDDCVFMF
uniref:Uncharacterized protein n=1 Tax=Arundo donax TaxID=35708 RepID=A0A0A9A4U4_ARUDO